MTEDLIEVIDWGSKWEALIKNAYRDDCSRINRQYPFVRTINIDLNLVPQDLFMPLLEKPEDAVTWCKAGIKQSGLIPNWNGDENTLNVRFYNHPQVLSIKELGSTKLRKFLCFEGVVRRVYSTKPIITLAVFRCGCGRYTEIRQPERDLISPVEVCQCGRKSTSQKLVPERCETVDSQVLVIQEAPDRVVGSEMPESIVVNLRDDLCKQIAAGNRVTVTGVMSSYQVKPIDKVLNVEFEASFVEILDQEFMDIEITPQEECEILSMAEDPEVWDKIIASVAPSVFGNEEVKEGIALQLFGGVSGYNGDGSWNRGDIHELLIGDPGIAKSKILKIVSSLCPRCVRISGSGSSAAGLTAAAVTDGSGGWILDAGAAVVADMGFLIADEADKMNKDDRSALHSAMEDQEIPINKAGINTVLKSRCSMLFAANPVSGRFDDYEDLSAQFNLPPTLLSRFDLIFVCRDVPNKEEDELLAEFILNGRAENNPPYPPELLRKYISYARQNFKPELSVDAKKEIKKFYGELRAMGGEGKAMPITPRQLEGVIRLTRARAKARLSPVAEASDARVAIRVQKDCLRHVAYDPDEGIYDIDRVCSTASKAKRDLMVDLKAVIIEAGRGEAVPLDIIMREMRSHGHDLTRVQRILDEGYDNGAFTQPRRGTYKVC